MTPNGTGSFILYATVRGRLQPSPDREADSGSTTRARVSERWESCSETPFYGSVLNVILGVDSHPLAGEVITASWFVACLWFSRLLGK